MKAIISALLMMSILLGSSIAAADIQRFSGANSGRPPPFTVEGPWTLDWNARSDSVDLASIELRLYDGSTGEFIGMIAEVKGTGSGLKLFENGGTFQVAVVGTLVEWDIEIEEISEELAAEMKRESAGRPSLVDTATRASRRVPENSFTSWRPQGNEQLLLFEDDRVAWRISFSPACPGLGAATAISFVMPADGTSLGQYDSILLDDGTRCYFQNVVPGGVPR